MVLTRSTCRARSSTSGYSLLEVVIAMLLLSIGALAIVPLFVTSARSNAIGNDLGLAGALAVERLEQLRATGWNDLADGGDLTANVNGYFDASNPDCLVRWTIRKEFPIAQTMLIQVSAVPQGLTVGAPKTVSVEFVRGR